MLLTIERYLYFDGYTRGRLYVGDKVYQTVERPWIPSEFHLGGKNFESCIPEGDYFVHPFSSEAHPDCYVIVNHDLNVYVEEPPKGDEGGRWAILLHVGNSVEDVVGCVAPGMSGDSVNVWHSRAAMDELKETLGLTDHRLCVTSMRAVN